MTYASCDLVCLNVYSTGFALFLCEFFLFIMIFMVLVMIKFSLALFDYHACCFVTVLPQAYVKTVDSDMKMAYI